MSDYEKGRWDMFVEISTAWHGKQYYFLQNDGMVYSRESGFVMTPEQAYAEFTKRVWEV